MSDDKKQSEDKKYVQISRDFIRHCSESIGFSSVSNDIPVLLSEDVTYRLREVVQSAAQYMRHSKRKKLTNEDVNKALRWSDVEPVYGYSSTDPLPFHYVKEADVYCVEDHEINLVLMANGRHAFQHPGHPIVRAHWQALEGVQSTASSSAAGKKNGVVPTPAISEELMAYYHQVTKAILGNNEEVTKAALDDLKSNSKIALLLPFFINFFSVGVKKVSHDLTQLTKLLNTVRSLVHNPHLYLEPQPFLKYIVQGVLYCIVEPLAASLNPINDHWALRDYASRLLANIIRLWNTPVNQLYEHTLSTLRDAFADLTKPFSSHYGAVVGVMALGAEPVRTCVYPNMTRYWPHLQSAIDDTSISNAPFKSDAHKVYGALLLASEFLILGVHREIRAEQTEADSDDEQADCFRGANSTAIPLTGGPFHPPPGPTREDTSVSAPSTSSLPPPGGGAGDSKFKTTVTVKREPVDAVRMVGGGVRKEPPTPFSAQEAYGTLCGFFGDALAARLPHVHLDRFYVTRSEPLVNLFTTPDTMETGEELLEAFNVKEDEVQSNSMEDDRYSYDDNSLMSDDGEGEPENVDLRIKSSVSDPIQGIKLTIAKLPRAPQPPVTIAAISSGGDAKVSKLSIKISKEQIVVPTPPVPSPPPPVVASLLPLEEEEPSGPFEVVSLRPPLYMEFNFEGAMPIARHLLARKHPGGTHPLFQTPITSEVHRLSLRMKPIGRRRRGLPTARERLVRAFRSGSVTTLL